MKFYLQLDENIYTVRQSGIYLRLTTPASTTSVVFSGETARNRVIISAAGNTREESADVRETHERRCVYVKK